MWITTSVEEIARRIVDDREEALGDRVGQPPRQIVDKPQPQPVVAEPAPEPEQPSLEESPLRVVPNSADASA